jgi:hypothetical protein
VRDERTGNVERVDIPMRAIAGGYYEKLIRMYEYLGVPFHPVRFLFIFGRALSPILTGSKSHNGEPEKDEDAFAAACAGPGTYFVHASNLHQTPPPWPGNRGVVSHLVEIVYLIVCQFWFTFACFFIQPRMLPVSGGKLYETTVEETLSQYLERIWLPRRFITHYLLPLMCSVSTCSHAEQLAFPASDVINYKKRSHGRQHYAVCGGVHQVQSRLTAGIKDVRLGVRVLDVAPNASSRGVIVRSQINGRDSEEVFDRVILAMPPDAVGRIFSLLRGTMGKLPAIRVESSVFGSPSVKGESGRYTIVDLESNDSIECSHHRTNAVAREVLSFKTQISDGDTHTEAFQIMPSGVAVKNCPLDPTAESDRILHTARFTRVLRTPESREIVGTILGQAPETKDKIELDCRPASWINGDDNVWLTGAWCWDGMVLLEGCVVSAMRVAKDFGVKVPW